MVMRDETPVLVVDDEEEYLGDFKVLFSEKFNILTACGSEKALAMLEVAPVAVVISDYRMPKMTGGELLAEISRLYPNTVRILLTGYADINALINAVNRGEIYRYVSKDLGVAEIEIVIRQAIDKYRIEEANRRLIEELQRLKTRKEEGI